MSYLFQKMNRFGKTEASDETQCQGNGLSHCCWWEYKLVVPL